MSTTETSDFCPYKGLQPYTEADSKYFFGRNRDREIIAANLYAAPLTVLHGASGVGKSSVLMAGVVPQLRKTARLAVIVFRNWQTGDFVGALKEEALRAVISVLGEGTADALRAIEERRAQEQAALREVEKRLKEEGASQSAADERLARNKRAVLDALGTFETFLRNEKGFDLKAIAFDDLLLQCRLVSGNPIFFIFDQFEEYFLYHPSADGKGGFDAELARAVNRRDVEANFLFSLREDGLSKLDRFQGRIPNLLGNMLRLEHLDRVSAEEAIRKPLDKYNRDEPGHPGPVEIEDALVDKLLYEVQAGKVSLDQTGQGQVAARGGIAPSAARIETPFLQMVLIRLWDAEVEKGSRTLRLSTLKELGGAESIVRTHLDSVMERLRETDPDYPNIAALLFRFLVTPSGMKIAHTLGDLADLSELPEDKVRPVLEALMSVRILRPVDPPPGQPGGTRYEIFHDVLAAAILDWRARYVKDQKLVEAERQAEEARQRAKKEARSAARLRWLSVALAIVTVAAVVFGIYAISQRRKAHEEYRRAEAAKSDAVAARIKAENSESKALSALGAANQAEANAKEEKAKAERAGAAAITEQKNADEARRQAAEQTRLANHSKMEAAAAVKDALAQQAISKLYEEAVNLSRNYDTWEGAIGKYMELVSIYQKSGELSKQAATLVSVAEIEIARERRIHPLSFSIANTNALKYYEEARSLYRRAKNLKEEASLLMYLGSIYGSFDETQKPRGFFEQAARVYAEARDLNGEIVALETILVRFEHGLSKEEQLQFYFRLLPLYRRNADFRNREVASLRAIGEIYFNELNDKRKSLEYYLQLLSALEKDGGKDELPKTLKIIGDIYFLLGEKQKALDHYLKSIAPSLSPERQFDVRDLAILLASIGDVYFQLNDPQKAAEYYLRLQTVKYCRCNALIKIGDMYTQLNDKQKSLDYYLQALAASEKEPGCLAFNFTSSHQFAGPARRVSGRTPLPNEVEAELLKKIASTYESSGDKQKAEEYHRRAEKVRGEGLNLPN